MRRQGYAGDNPWELYAKLTLEIPQGEHHGPGYRDGTPATCTSHRVKRFGTAGAGTLTAGGEL